MTYSAMIEDRDTGGFTATILGWPDCTAAGSTRREALARLRQAVLARLSKVEIVPLEIELPENAHPWMKFAGMYEEDPLFDEVLEDVQSYRREMDADSEK